MNNILILGGSGILGSSLVNECKLGNVSYAAPGSSDLDITKLNEIQHYFTLHQPSAIVNCAAWTDVEKSEIEFQKASELNADAVKNLALTAKQAEIPLIHISTDYVFDGAKEGRYSENDQTSPINGYGVTKLQGENYLLELLPESAYIIRTSWLYGTSGKNFVKSILRKALAQERIQVVADQVGSPTNSEDLARGILGILTKRPQEGVYHFSNRGQISWYEFAVKIYELAESDVRLVEPIASQTYSSLVKRPSNTVLSTVKWDTADITKITAWEESLRNILPKMLESLRKENMA
ncbi:dTDP-4-dehydrorhamnose reductase [Candidatus Planktophila dulcis]|uniref:dTDP-4-dehydrorhamnose reductase n=1 Tax=Candidatus Planktophila dulcis TaxID=1884914 RepID=UPI003BEEFF50